MFLYHYSETVCNFSSSEIKHQDLPWHEGTTPMMNGATTDASMALKLQKGLKFARCKNEHSAYYFPFLMLLIYLSSKDRHLTEGEEAGHERWDVSRFPYLSLALVWWSNVMKERLDKREGEWRGGLFLEYERLMLSRWGLGALESLVQCAWITINHMLWSWCICIHTHIYTGVKGIRFVLGFLW